MATVSKVLNSRYGVAVSTSERVQAAIDELGYESSLVARSLRSHRTNVIGVLVGEFDAFGCEILKGTSQAIGRTGYELLAYCGGDTAGWERRCLSRLGGTLIDGAILVTPTVAEASASVPVVAIDPQAGPTGLPTVDSDNFGGAVLATEHLLRLGHRRIGFLGGRPDLESSRQREEGYRMTLAGAGIAVDPALMRVGGYRRESAREPAHDLLTLQERPSAIFAANDLSALGTLDAARELGMSAPDDISVVGFDDVPESALTEPSLTTVHQPIQLMGAAAVRLLIDLLDGRGDRSAHVRLPTELVERGSTRALSAS